MQPSRMPSYSVQNDGVGPYAVFSCEACGRDYRSAPALAKTVQQAVTRSALGGFLRNIPVVGNAAANQLDDQQYRTSMAKEELADAWSQVAAGFHECTVCHQVVCATDFDAPADTCREHSPRSDELEAHDAAQQGAQAAAASATCASCGTPLAAGARFCASCGTPVAQARTCASCGVELAAGARFCSGCGTAAS